MVLKRSVYFIVAAWLITSIVLFYANNKAGIAITQKQNTGIIDLVTGHNTTVLDTDDHTNSDNKGRSHKRAPRKILPRRIAEFNVQLPIILDFVKGNIAIDIHRTFGAHLFSKAFLPGYYNFLFRYKPF
jgi:hypothetical protein